jgi:hypothetical protein
MQEKMPDGKIYIEYHFEQTAIKQRSKKKKYHQMVKIYNRIDYFDKAYTFLWLYIGFSIIC